MSATISAHIPLRPSGFPPSTSIPEGLEQKSLSDVIGALLETGEKKEVVAKMSIVGVGHAKFVDRVRTTGMGMQGIAYCRTRQTLCSPIFRVLVVVAFERGVLRSVPSAVKDQASRGSNVSHCTACAAIRASGVRVGPAEAPRLVRCTGVRKPLACSAGMT